MKYSYLSLEERYKIAEMYNAGVTIAKIAAELGRNPSTIFRELMRGDTGERDKDTSRIVYDPELGNENVKISYARQRRNIAKLRVPDDERKRRKEAHGWK